MVPFLISPLLQNIPIIHHGFMTRNGGVSKEPHASLNVLFGKGDEDDNVRENRRRIAETFDESLENLCTVKQVHGTRTALIEHTFTDHNRPEADAMVTKTPGVILGILTADCVPVLFVDPVAKVIGAAHAGWKGATQGVLQNTITTMEDLGAHRDHIQAALGPCIWQPSYEVDQTFFENLPYDAEFFIPSSRPHHWMFDLPGYVEKVLRQSGLKAISASPQDTLSNLEQFYSHRRWTLTQKPPLGCQLSIIKLARSS